MPAADHATHARHAAFTRPSYPADRQPAFKARLLWPGGAVSGGLPDQGVFVFIRLPANGRVSPTCSWRERFNLTTALPPLTSPQAEDQIKWFDRLEGITLYQNRVPLHALDSARLIGALPAPASRGSSASDIFVTENGDFSALSGQDIQAIFRQRHILVLNAPGTGGTFGLQNLSGVGDLDAEVEVQGQFTDPCPTVSHLRIA